jgi:hypothetical protein
VSIGDKLVAPASIDALYRAVDGAIDDRYWPKIRPTCLRQRTKSIEEALHSAMLAKKLPLLLLSPCASTAQLPTTDQPELAEMARSYVQQLQAVGITRVISPGSRAMVRLDTSYGPVYVQYPAVAKPLAFVLDIGPDGLQAAAATFDPARDAQILAALVPEAVRMTATNNRFAWLRANPWH